MGRTPGRSALGLLGSFVVMAALGCGVATDRSNADGTITIQNSSTHVLEGVYIAAVDQSSWGPNLLPGVLLTSDQLTVQVSCSTYDVMVTDDRQRNCVLGNLDLCFSDQVWVIDNGTLVRRAVTTGRHDESQGLVEVLAGLTPTTQVLAARFDNLREGAKAVVVSRAAPVASAAASSSAR